MKFTAKWKLFNSNKLWLYRRICFFWTRYCPFDSRKHEAEIKMNTAVAQLEKAWGEYQDVLAEENALHKEIRKSYDTEAHEGPEKVLSLKLFRPKVVQKPEDNWSRFISVLRSGKSSIADELGLESVQVVHEDDDVIIVETDLNTAVVGAESLEIKKTNNNQSKKNNRNNRNNNNQQNN